MGADTTSKHVGCLCYAATLNIACPEPGETPTSPEDPENQPQMQLHATPAKPRNRLSGPVADPYFATRSHGLYGLRRAPDSGALRLILYRAGLPSLGDRLS
jgi:hypothetical protein